MVLKTLIVYLAQVLVTATDKEAEEMTILSRETYLDACRKPTTISVSKLSTTLFEKELLVVFVTSISVF